MASNCLSRRSLLIAFLTSLLFGYSTDAFALDGIGVTSANRSNLAVGSLKPRLNMNLKQWLPTERHAPQKLSAMNNDDNSRCPNPSYVRRRDWPSPAASGRAQQCSASPTRLDAMSPLTSAAAATAAAIRGGTSTARGIGVGVGSYYLVRILFLRGLAFVYGVAFLVALHQNRGLIGDNGITPARECLDAAEERGRLKRERRRVWIEQRKRYRELGDREEDLPAWFWLRNTTAYRALEDRIEGSRTFGKIREVLWDRSDRMGRPLLTLLWLAKERRRLDPWLDWIAIAGLGMSAIVLSLGAANVPLLFGMWLCQRSLMAVGGPWYGFGWEPQLAELGFHALFLVPLLSLNPFPSTPVPEVVIWTLRWYLFRIMLGAGLIKIKSGDRKWKDLTAMNNFYMTQPVPNPFSKYFHAAPKGWHKFEVLTNHFVELVAPWLLVLPGLPRPMRIAGGVIQIIFQSILISSGNLSFLNWLTAVPAVWCLDDAFLLKVFHPFSTASASAAAYVQLVPRPVVSLTRKLVTATFGVLIVKLSIPVVQNLVAKRQLMNASFDRYRLVNSYGAFGVVSDVREELIIESADKISGPWREYHFKVKPGDVTRRPPWISPYHYRLDWLIWIASQCGSIERSPWMFRFLKKLLEEDEGVLGLMESNPEEGNSSAESSGKHEDGEESRPSTPKYIRVEKYRYEFNYDTELNEDGIRPYWKRERIGRYFPRQGIVNKEILSDIIEG